MHNFCSTRRLLVGCLVRGGKTYQFLDSETASGTVVPSLARVRGDVMDLLEWISTGLGPASVWSSVGYSLKEVNAIVGSAFFYKEACLCSIRSWRYGHDRGAWLQDVGKKSEEEIIKISSRGKHWWCTYQSCSDLSRPLFSQQRSDCCDLEYDHLRMCSRHSPD